ncbi:unnamed protein product [Nippostrongylus brasiliensis]|uniref:Uncharacterized protein n=1 Tax=Nippostrongylus brasiliensis TaxID=27835 RepID=A0A0N4XK38_NIPBR|nr:unnamed protein product [Nippostrongylus brasiliensis]
MSWKKLISNFYCKQLNVDAAGNLSLNAKDPLISDRMLKKSQFESLEAPISSDSEESVGSSLAAALSSASIGSSVRRSLRGVSTVTTHFDDGFSDLAGVPSASQPVSCHIFSFSFFYLFMMFCFLFIYPLLSISLFFSNRSPRHRSLKHLWWLAMYIARTRNWSLAKAHQVSQSSSSG